MEMLPFLIRFAVCPTQVACHRSEELGTQISHILKTDGEIMEMTDGSLTRSWIVATGRAITAVTRWNQVGFSITDRQTTAGT
jgi:hypothetical protein